MIGNSRLNGFCASNNIAGGLESKARSVLADKINYDKKYNSLKNGAQATQWADKKGEVIRLQQIIESETLKLNQEEEIERSLGLGLFCNKAKRRRRQAESTLQAAERSLGIVKGSFDTLDRQQKEGIIRASDVILLNQKTIEGLTKELNAVKARIAKYKADRDAEKANKALIPVSDTSVNSTKKINTAGFISKENLPLIGGGILLLSAIVYLRNQGKTTTIRKKTVKKVAA